MSLFYTDRETEAWGNYVIGLSLQNELLTILETDDLSYSQNRYSMVVSGKALVLFPSRWFSPVFLGLASKDEKGGSGSTACSVFIL